MQNIAVSLIEPRRDTRQLHADLLTISTDMGSTFDEPRYTADGYRPHATIQPDIRLHDKYTPTVNSFMLVDMYPSHDIEGRSITVTYLLK